MRLLRALAHLVLALALAAVMVAQTQAAVCAPVAAPSHAQQGHQAVHDHGGPAAEHPTHKRDTCRTVCCFVAAQAPAHAPESSAAAFFRSVRYVIDAEPVAGRALAPEPGIPKPLA